MKNRRKIKIANIKANLLGIPPVLYLRAFQVDHLRVFDIADNPTFEEILANELRKIGQLTIIYKPEDEIHNVGINPLYPGDEDWKKTVLTLIESSSIILLRPSHTEGLLWEFEQIVKSNFLYKTILYLQMGSEPEYEMQEARYNIFVRKTKFLNISFPQYNPKEPLIYFNSQVATNCKNFNEIPVYNSLITEHALL